MGAAHNAVGGPRLSQKGEDLLPIPGGVAQFDGRFEPRRQEPQKIFQAGVVILEVQRGALMVI